MAIGIVPLIILQLLILRSYESRAVQQRLMDVQEQCKIVSNQLQGYGYLDNTQSEVMDAVLTQLSNLFNGRVLIIDGNYRVVKDTYMLEEGKTVISEEVLRCFLGESSSNYSPRYQCVEAVAPVYAVRGNNDRWAPFLPRELRVTLGGVTFYLVHNRLDVPMDLTGVNVVVYGHSHRYVQQEEGGVLWLNPGSCGPRRFRQEITMAEAVVTDGRVLVGKITLPEDG